MWRDGYWKNTLQLKFRNNFLLARVMAESLKIGVNTDCFSSVGELINQFPLPN